MSVEDLSKLRLAMKNHLSNFEAYIAKKRKGRWEDDGDIRIKMKEECYQLERKWFSLFYEHGVISPEYYADDIEFIYEVLKRYCYETFGKNVFKMEEFMLDSHFQSLFETKINPEDVNELANYHKHLLFSESRIINEFYESDNEENIHKVTSFFDHLRTFDEPFLYERDGFGMYRTVFPKRDERIYLHFNLEDQKELISFENASSGLAVMNSINRVASYRDSIVRMAFAELSKWAANEVSSIYRFDSFGFYSHVDEDVITMTISYHGKKIIEVIDSQEQLTRLNGDIVYNTDTLVRELFEYAQLIIMGREKAQLRAADHFRSTLSTQDIIGDDFVRLTGANFDYVIFANHDIIRVEKGKPLTPEFVHRLCIHPQTAEIPRFDGYATLSMMIKSGMESMINTIANAHPLREFDKINSVYAGA